MDSAVAAVERGRRHDEPAPRFVVDEGDYRNKGEGVGFTNASQHRLHVVRFRI